MTSDSPPFCTLRSFVLENHSSGEGGQFEMPVHITRAQLRQQSDPRGFVNREIGLHLTQAILDTEVPKEFWYAEFSTFAQRAFDFPEIVKFGG